MQPNRQGKITIYAGPMFAGKTSHLATLYNNGFINHIYKSDSRESDNVLITHDGIAIPAIRCERMAQVMHLAILGNESCIAIDEAQFFDAEELKKYCCLMANCGISIHIAMLDMDCFGGVWPAFSQIAGVADEIIKLHSTCSICGSGATMTRRIADGSDVVLIGSEKEYQPICRRCFFDRKERRQ